MGKKSRKTKNTKPKAKRKANWYAKRVGALVRKGLTFKQAAHAAKAGLGESTGIRRLKGGARKAKRSVKAMARKGGGGGRRQQGIVSWVRALLTLFIAFFYPVRLLMSGDVDQFTHDATMGLSSGGFDKEAALRMYGPMGGALVFHQITGELNKRVKMNSLIPALRA